MTTPENYDPIQELPNGKMVSRAETISKRCRFRPVCAENTEIYRLGFTAEQSCAFFLFF